MKNLRGFIVPVVMAGLVGLSGCADSTSTSAGPDAGATAQPTSEVPADPKAALAGSTKELASGNYAFTATSPEADAKGTVHVPSKSASIALNGKTEGFEIKMDLIFAGPDRWIRMVTPKGQSILDQSADPKTWLHVDGSKLKNADLGVDLTQPDLLYIGKIVDAATEVKGDAHTITGKLDATKIDSADAFLDSETAKDMGPTASALPFTASLDDQGRLTKLEIDAPKAKEVPAGKWTITVAGYGQQKAQTPPSGKVKEMSDEQLKIFS
jgi:hypothetical protein